MNYKIKTVALYSSTLTLTADCCCQEVHSTIQKKAKIMTNEFKFRRIKAVGIAKQCPMDLVV
jgi:hypothetical protein